LERLKTPRELHSELDWHLANPKIPRELHSELDWHLANPKVSGTRVQVLDPQVVR
jgi:hypothetical protein